MTRFGLHRVRKTNLIDMFVSQQTLCQSGQTQDYSRDVSRCFIRHDADLSWFFTPQVFMWLLHHVHFHTTWIFPSHDARLSYQWFESMCHGMLMTKIDNPNQSSFEGLKDNSQQQRAVTIRHAHWWGRSCCSQSKTYWWGKGHYHRCENANRCIAHWECLVRPLCDGSGGRRRIRLKVSPCLPGPYIHDCYATVQYLPKRVTRYSTGWCYNCINLSQLSLNWLPNNNSWRWSSLWARNMVSWLLRHMVQCWGAQCHMIMLREILRSCD